MKQDPFRTKLQTFIHIQQILSFLNTSLPLSFNFKHQVNQRSQLSNCRTSKNSMLFYYHHNVWKVFDKKKHQNWQRNSTTQHIKQKEENAHKQTVFNITYQVIPIDLRQGVDSPRLSHHHHWANQETRGWH